MPKKPVKDVFGFWLIEQADFSGKYEIPRVQGTSEIPTALVSFSRCIAASAPASKAIHFYEFDEKFITCLSNQNKLSRKLSVFRQYQSVILPDFSVYRDMPLTMQIFHVYKSRAVGAFLEKNGVNIIPNVRWGDERTYEFAFDGIPDRATVAVGVQGGYRDRLSRFYFEKGFIEMINSIHPKTILCYGSLRKEFSDLVAAENIVIKTYPTEIKARFQKMLPFSAAPLSPSM